MEPEKMSIPESTDTELTEERKKKIDRFTRASSIQH